MRKEETYDDSWGCVPELKEAVGSLDNIGHEIYEIKNCVRQTTLENLVSEMINSIDEAMELLKSIDTDVEFVTQHDDE